MGKATLLSVTLLDLICLSATAVEVTDILEFSLKNLISQHAKLSVGYARLEY